MADESLVSDDLRSYEGRRGPERRVSVTAAEVARSLGVYGGEGRLFQPGDVVPGYTLMSLAPDGESSDLRMPEPMPQALMVSNEFSLERPLRLGEDLTAQSCIASISERLGGRFGHGIYVRRELEFRDTDGDIVGRTASTLMYYRTEGADLGEDQ
ncbi:MAG: hypothetical protein ACE5EF_11580 [Dehalococcoidia bacterium]